MLAQVTAKNAGDRFLRQSVVHILIDRQYIK